MSLVHPVLEPSIALNASVGNFLGDTRKWVALQYSNRVVFKQILGTNGAGAEPVTFAAEEISIPTPQPPMTMGSPDDDILPTLGGAFFTAGRRKDLLVLQVSTALVVVSVNPIETTFDLEGTWGLPRVEARDRELRDGARTSGTTTPIKRPASSLSLASLAETGIDPFIASVGSINKNITSQLSHMQLAKTIGLHPDMPVPQPSPDGTQIFLSTRNKNKNPVLVVISCYGKEVIRLEVEYLDILTLGWINDDVVYFVYMNSKFHKKFQTASVGSKAKSSGLFGMGRRLVVPSLVYQMNVLISADFIPSRRDVGGGPDLVFGDYVLLGTRRGTYLRVNHKLGTWEPVKNVANVVGAVTGGSRRLVVMNAKGKRASASPTDFAYALVSDGEMHRVDVAPELGMCLSSGHSIDSENRFVLKLLHLGSKDCVLDYKRYPMRLYQLSQDTVKVADTLPLPSRTSGRLTTDFIFKTEQAIYTRDPNGEDNQMCKIVDREVLTIVLDRPGLRGLEKRAEKSMWAAFTSVNDHVPEVRIIEESHKVFKLKTKAHYTFTNRRGWHLTRIVPVHRNVAIVVLGLAKETTKFSNDAAELLAMVGDFKKWEIYVMNFVGALSKSDPIKPRAHLILDSKAPEIPPTPLPLPGSASVCDSERKKLSLHTYNAELNGFSCHNVLSVWKDGKFELNESPEDALPFALNETDDVSFFTDFKASSDGVFLVGAQNSTEHKITDVLTVEAPGATFGKPIILFNKNLSKSVIWLFDSNGTAFREFAPDSIPQEKARHYEHQERMLQMNNQKQLYSLSPDFRRKYFREVASSDTFRTLPELLSRVCAGSGVDAEAYVKAPDNGVFAVFRMQNKRLLDGFRRLEQVINEKCVGSWLPDVLKEQWLNERKSSSMVAGVAFAALWRFSEDRQKELCKEADFDFELLKKVCPP